MLPIPVNVVKQALPLAHPQFFLDMYMYHMVHVQG
jgi:hypothetical protein